MEPARTCLGCRSRDNRAALLRLVVREGHVIPDQSGSLDGRGAWVHPTLECIDAADKRRAWSRAFRTAVLDATAVRTALDGSTEPPERTG